MTDILQRDPLPEDEGTLEIEVNEEAAKEVPETEQQTQEQKQDEIREILKEYGLDDRYEGREGLELVKELAKSYKNADQFIETLKREKMNLEGRQILADRVLQQWNQMQQQATQQPPRIEASTPEEEAAFKWLTPILDQREQQYRNALGEVAQFTDANIYAYQRALGDEEFRSALGDGALERKRLERGYPLSRQGVDATWDAICAERRAGVMARQKELAQADSAKRESFKKKAAVEGGGMKTMESQLNPVQRMHKRLAGVTDPDEVQRILTEEFGIEVAR